MLCVQEAGHRRQYICHMAHGRQRPPTTGPRQAPSQKAVHKQVNQDDTNSAPLPPPPHHPAALASSSTRVYCLQARLPRTTCCRQQANMVVRYSVPVAGTAHTGQARHGPGSGVVGLHSGPQSCHIECHILRHIHLNTMASTTDTCQPILAPAVRPAARGFLLQWVEVSGCHTHSRARAGNHVHTTHAYSQGSCAGQSGSLGPCRPTADVTAPHRHAHQIPTSPRPPQRLGPLQQAQQATPAAAPGPVRAPSHTGTAPQRQRPGPATPHRGPLNGSHAPRDEFLQSPYWVLLFRYTQQRWSVRQAFPAQRCLCPSAPAHEQQCASSTDPPCRAVRLL